MSDFATLEDSGFLIAIAHEPGIAHPPGYPLYTLLAYFFTFIPFGTIAERVQLLSSFTGIITCVLLFKICKKLGIDNFSSFLGSMCLGISSSFWYLSITAEVYTLNAMFFLLIFYIGLKICEKPDIDYLWMLFSFVFGLSLTNHWPLMILTLPAIFFILIPFWSLILSKIIKLIIFFCLGLTPYLYLPIRSFHEPYLNFFQLLPNWEMFWWYVSRAAYANNDQYGSWYESFLFIKNFFLNLPEEIGYIPIILSIFGLIIIINNKNRNITLSVFYSIFSSSVLLKLIYQNDFNQEHWEMHKTYNLIPIIFFCFSFSQYTSFLLNKFIKLNKIIKILLTFTLIFQTLINFNSHNLRYDSFSKDISNIILNSLPLNSNYFIHASEELGILTYANIVEGVRSDIKLYSQNGVLFGNRLFNIDSSYKTMRNQINDFLYSGEEIYSMELRPLFKKSLNPDWKIIEDNGFKLITLKNDNIIKVEQDDKKIVNILDKWNEGIYTNRWLTLRRRLILRYCNLFMDKKNIHSIFNNDPTCNLYYTLNIKKKGDYKLAEQRFIQIKNDYDINYFNTEEQKSIYHNLLYLGIQRVNNMKGGWDVKLSEYKKILENTIDGIYINNKCDKKFINYLMNIKKQIPFKLDILMSNELLHKCFSNLD